MARASFRVRDSSYYPPRARWYNRPFANLETFFRRWVHLERLGFKHSLSVGAFLLGILVPAYAFFALGRRWLGWLFLSIYIGAVAVFIVRLGFPEADVAFGLLIFAHATSIVFVESVWVGNERFGLRVGLAICTLVAVWGLMYGPLVRFAERHFVMPVRIGERVVVVNRAVSPSSLKRGDWVAYQISEKHIGGPGNMVAMGAGLGLDPVLGLPGDTIGFTREAVSVNQQSLPRRELMPLVGELLVPQKVWFIWPVSSMNVTGPRANEAGATELLQRTAMVGQKEILGRPFRHWFWRRQWP